MPEEEETPSTPGWLGDGILENGVDQGAARRAAIRQAEADRAARKGQERAERPQRATVPGKPAPPREGPPCAHAGPCASRAAWPGSPEARS